MQQRVITVVLLIGLCFGLITLGSGVASWRLPDHEQGYAPEQPIAYSHRLHAGELGIDCLFCGVSIVPGITQLTLMFDAFNSPERLSVSRRTAVFITL